MARSGVQYEDVQRAVHALLTRGEAPSVQKVREVLGTGSFTTISDHLRQWRVEREENRDVPPPQDLPEHLLALATELWRQAQQAASEGLVQYREDADRQIAESREQARESARQAEDAAQRETATAEHLAKAQERLEVRGADCAKAEAERDAALARERQAVEQVALLKAELERLQIANEDQAKQHQQAMARLGERHQEQLGQEEQRHEAAEARLMTLLDGARQERQAADKQHVARHGELEKRLDALNQQLQAQRASLAEEQQQHREALWELRHHRDNEREIQLRLKRQESQLEEQRQALATAQEKLRDAEDRLTRTTLPPFVY